MTDGRRIVTVPRHDPVDALTMGGILRMPALRRSNSANFSERARELTGTAPAPLLRKDTLAILGAAGSCRL